MKNTFILSLYNIVLHFSLGFISKKKERSSVKRSEKRLHVCESHAQHMT